MLQEGDVLLVVLQPGLSLSNLHDENTELTISGPMACKSNSESHWKLVQFSSGSSASDGISRIILIWRGDAKTLDYVNT